MKLPCATLLALASFAPVQACGTFAASATGARRFPVQIDGSDDAANGGSHSAPFPWAGTWCAESRTGSSRSRLVLPVLPATRAW